MYIFKASACSLGVVGDWAVAWRRRRCSHMFIYEVSACSLGVASHVYLQSLGVWPRREHTSIHHNHHHQTASIHQIIYRTGRFVEPTTDDERRTTGRLNACIRVLFVNRVINSLYKITSIT
jgi:hypothetical protein